MKFHKNYFSRDDVAPRVDRPTDSQADGQTDISNLVVAFRNFVSAPKTLRRGNVR
jgi:hypothetical protein